ncbi:serine/threonine-protein kinase ATR [Selaginella moellendorffii]|nr:serine/threonine-protein kinase ATR [Selaginella moellendorffii]|eukprot:XP_024518074.1 serine/threonine-protein kinase ATR [Selaginella moellendorffii]
MVDLSALLQDLGDCIASKLDSSSETQPENDDPVESRFRSVLPVLLDAYFLPEKVKGREILAILKLVRHTVDHFPGVLFHGKAHAVLPVVARLIPLLAEPAASGCCECLFETLRSLVSILRKGEWEVFQYFFIDALLLVEDLASVGSFFSPPTRVTSPATISVNCFQESFSCLRGKRDGDRFLALSCWESSNAPGLSIDVTGKARWEPLAVYVIKLLTHFFTEDSFHVRGLVTPCFMFAIGTIMCYGSSNLHKVCFEMFAVGTSELDADVVPSEKAILSILAVLSLPRNGELPAFRTSTYDSSLGSSLLSLYSKSAPDVVKCTAQKFLELFPTTIMTSASRDLKVAFCNILSIILKQCPIYSSCVLSFTTMIFVPDIMSPFSSCLQIAINADAGNAENGSKRRKLREGEALTCGVENSFDQMHEVFGRLEMENKGSTMPVESLLAGYCVLARSFCRAPGTDYLRLVLQHFCEWLILSKSKELITKLTKFQLSIILEAVEGLIFHPDSEIPELVFCRVKEVVGRVLEMPWFRFTASQGDSIWKAKLHVMTILSKMKEPERFNADHLLRLGLRDEDMRVRSAAVTCIPLLVAHSSMSWLKLSELLRGMDEDNEQVQEALCSTIGKLFCVAAANLVPTSDMQQLSCNICDNGIASASAVLKDLEYPYWKTVVLTLLLTNRSYRVQSAVVRNLSRLLAHSFEVDARDIWVKCLDVFPLHPDRSARKAFCSQLRGLLTQEHIWYCTVGHKSGDYEILKKLGDALAIATDPDVLETLMETVAEVGKVAKGDDLRVSATILLIEQLDKSEVSARAVSVRLICEIAAAQWPSDSNRCVERMVDSSSEILFEFFLKNLVLRPFLVKEFAEAVMKISTGDLLRKMIPYVLPKLILDQQHDERAPQTLNALAHLLQTSLPLVLLEWCHKVLSVLLLRADGRELMAALHFYEAQTGSDAREIFAAVLPALLDELVWFLGDTSNDEAVKRSARVGPMIQEVARIISGSDDLPSFLRQHFVRLLNNIDRKLLRSEDVQMQKQALRCIERLLEMIGSHLSAFIPKIMALLSQPQDLQYESLSVWLSFVKRLAQVSPANLKTVASQIVVALMPCLESEQSSTIDAAVQILEELILKNRRLLGDQIKELPLLPSLEPLAAVNAVLNEVRGFLSLRDQLLRAGEGLNHESLSLRLVTATELLKLLSSKRNDITALVLRETPADADAVSSLVTRLLRGCSEESRTSAGQKFKLACAECLGGLGAIDPVKLQISLRHRSSMQHTEEDLVFQLINQHLTRVLRAASDTDVQDAAALAIQELLKLTGCHEARGVSRPPSSSSKPTQKSKLQLGDRLWSRFSDAVKEIISPCLTSKYLLKVSGAPMPSGPIFRQGILFRRWMYLWCRRLLSQVTGQMASILGACRGVVRHDMDTALYILPYLILDIVCHGCQEARTGVTDEILAVLAEAGTGNDGQPGQPVYLNNAFCGSGGEVSMQTVFMLLDNLGQWVDDSKALTSKGSRSTQAKELSAKLLVQCEQVGQLLASIPKQSLASASFRCRAYARALLYYESYVREKSGALNPAALVSGTFKDEDVGFLLKIYGGLDEPDGLLGIARLQKRASLEDQVLINKISGNWAEALTFCEQALELEPKSLYWQSGILDCLVNMGHFQAMVTHVDGLLARLRDSRREWYMRGVQAAWRLGQWDLINEYVHGSELEAGSTESDSAFDLSLAKVLQALRSKDQVKFQEQLTHARLALLAPLAAASMESYVRAYPVIVKLHMLRELEDFFSLADKGGDNKDQLFENWNGRLKMTLPSLSTREPILALRRLLFSVCDLQSEMGGCWLQYAKLCRTSGHYETANRAILQAQAAGAPNAHRERAKLFWDMKKTHRAIDELQQVLVNVPLSVLGTASGAALSGLVLNTSQTESALELTVEEQVCNDAAKTLLLLGRWAHCTGQKQKEDVISIYTRVKDLQPMWEKGYFYMARYYDDLLVDARKRQEENKEHRSNTTKRGSNADDKPWWTYLPDTVLCYAKTLHRSHHHLFQALPRLLTLWFEFGSAYRSESLGSNKIVKAAHVRVMAIMRGCLQELPSYQWLASLPQLVSRICHDNEEVVRLVKQIIQSVLQAYPQQALWTMAAVSKSDIPERRSAATEIIQAAKFSTRNDDERATFVQFATFIEHMVRLCFAPGASEKARSLTLSTSDFSSLKRMMPLQVIMPVQRALAVTLPADGLSNSSYNPFPSGDCSTIFAIRDDVEILVSLQRPKKVVLVASDGTEHPFLCKPKDDLRKDARMMEFTGMINRLLSKDPSSRRRKLYIRTFAVIPLTEDCGMVEWVSHTRGLRHILQDLYVSAGMFTKETNPTIKRIYEDNKDKKISATELMRDKILPMFPPVFHKWFLNTFPEPTAWFQSRLAYAHTTAVWSMVGHIVGLGDRHGENILYDSTTGDCVHVDFSCLFDKGLQLEKPELVPFRLTQNMVDGLGITGYEGVFLRTCEITLSVLRANRETLMSVLETFIHDPLVEWTKSHKSSATEVQNPHAQRALANIEARLQGVVVGVAAAPSLPLSVEGQAHRLIQEAVSHENLGHMYVWWMPWF